MHPTLSFHAACAIKLEVHAMYRPPRALEELVLKLIFEAIGESRYNRTPEEYEQLITKLGRLGLKKLHNLVNEKLTEYQRSGQPPWAAICRFQPGDRSLRFDEFPTAISLQTIRNALNHSGFREQKGVRLRRTKTLI
jgi:hypothetical protein